MSQNAETKIQNRALLAVGCRADVLATRLQSGVFRSYDDPERIVKVGDPGIADTMVFVATVITPDMVGKTIAIPAAAEIKTATGRQSKSQKEWQAAFEGRGGIYRVIRTPEEMVAYVEDVKAGRAFR